MLIIKQALFFVVKYTNVRIIALDLLLSYEFTRLLFAQQFITNFFCNWDRYKSIVLYGIILIKAIRYQSSYIYIFRKEILRLLT